mmetsp:Transcript_10979/g.46897  ORF Transcript_10979/g.46897 Transcript_10979/m.46897 type:complete len:200 (-) Transcript_10979:550-1149(-)
MWLFALAWSSCPPMVLSSLQSASTSSSSGFSGSDRSFWMHVCMMRSESICFLNSSPMNRMFPSMRRRACCMRSARSISARRSARSRSAAVMGAAGASPSSFSATPPTTPPRLRRTRMLPGCRSACRKLSSMSIFRSVFTPSAARILFSSGTRTASAYAAAAAALVAARASILTWCLVRPVFLATKRVLSFAFLPTRSRR